MARRADPDDDGQQPDDPAPTTSLLNRVLRARERPGSPWLLAVALALFLVFTFVAFRHLPHVHKPLRWELIVVAGLCVPVIAILNALEFRVMAHFAEHHPPVMEILHVTIMGSAANLLPVPGAVLVRLANLRKAGVRMTRGLNLSAIIGLTWVGSACVLGGFAEMASHTAFAATALAVGAGLLAVAIGMLARVLEPGSRLGGAGELLAIECGFVLMQALRLFLVASALRFDVSYAQSTVLVIAAVAAAAVGFLPGGLGAREAIAAALAPVVGFPAAVGLVITAVDRIINLVVFSVLAAVIAIAGRRSRTAPPRAARAR